MASHWRHGVEEKTGTFPINFTSQPENIAGCRSVFMLAEILGLSYSSLANLIYPDTKSKYSTFGISKKSGKIRIIDAPSHELKMLQKKLAEQLNGLYSPKPSAFGFIAGRSIVKNAEQHTCKNFVLNIDLSNFFHSITFGRVRQLMMADPFKMSAPVATVVAQICCLDGRLPQGAPTSPVISNIISYKLDGQLQHLAKSHNCTYSRYADDITFSFSHQIHTLPKNIIQLVDGKDIYLGETLRQIITQNGFSINENKTRLLPSSQRQLVTGLVVNSFVNMSRKSIKQIKSMIYAWDKFGLQNAADAHYGITIKDQGNLGTSTPPSRFLADQFKSKIRGKLAFMKMVRGKDDSLFLKLLDKYKYLSGTHPTPYEPPVKRIVDGLDKYIFVVKNNTKDKQGTSFLINGLGLITNSHVLEDINYNNADTLTVYSPFLDQEFTVNLLGHHPKLDCSLLEFSAPPPELSGLAMDTRSCIEINKPIIIAGYPNYMEGHSIYTASGTVTQSTFLFGQPAFLINAPVIHGNSGGPVFNNDLNVIGIATFGRKVNKQGDEFFGFIPLSVLSDWLASF